MPVLETYTDSAKPFQMLQIAASDHGLHFFLYTSIAMQNIAKEKIPHCFSYKTKVFSFQNSTKKLDLSYKMDLDLWDCL